MKNKNISYHLRHVSEEEYKEAPEAVHEIYISVTKKIPMDPKHRLAIIERYPQYFDKVQHSSFGQKLKRLLTLKERIEAENKKA